MKVLLTGANGFLGGALAKRLKEEGHELFIAVRRDPSKALSSISDRVFMGDLSDKSYVETCLDGVEAVIHTAAKPGIWGEYKDYYLSNVVSVQNLLDVCLKCGVKVFVYTGTPSAVFDMKDQKGIDETAPYPEKYYSHYPKTKAMAEKLVLSASSPDFRTISLRPHLIWGPGDRHLIPRLIARAKAGTMTLVNGGNNIIDITYIDNAVIAHILALKKLASSEWSKCAGKAYFITDGSPKPLNEILNSILEKFNLSSIKRDIPEPLAYAAGSLLEFYYFISGRKDEPLLTRFVVKEFSCDHWFDISASARDFGYVPSVSFNDGLERLRRWAFEHGLV